MRYQVQTPSEPVLVVTADNVTVNDAGVILFWSEGWNGPQIVTAFAPGHWFEVARLKGNPENQKTTPEGD